MKGREKGSVHAEVDYSNRRAHERRKLLRRVLIHVVDQESPLIISNLSRHGLRGTATVELAPHQRVYVGFDNRPYVSGEVTWVDGQDFGLLSHDTLRDVRDTEPDDRGTEEHHQPRESRIKTDISAVLITTCPVIEARARDISSGGLQIEIHTQLDPESRLLVEFPGKPLIMARIQWRKGPFVGVSFIVEADLGELLAQPPAAENTNQNYLGTLREREI